MRLDEFGVGPLLRPRAVARDDVVVRPVCVTHLSAPAAAPRQRDSWQSRLPGGSLQIGEPGLITALGMKDNHEGLPAEGKILRVF